MELLDDVCHMESRFGLFRNSVSVDTVFGYVSFDAHLESIECRSADETIVTSLQRSC